MLFSRISLTRQWWSPMSFSASLKRLLFFQEFMSKSCQNKTSFFDFRHFRDALINSVIEKMSFPNTGLGLGGFIRSNLESSYKSVQVTSWRWIHCILSDVSLKLATLNGILYLLDGSIHKVNWFVVCGDFANFGRAAFDSQFGLSLQIYLNPSCFRRHSTFASYTSYFSWYDPLSFVVCTSVLLKFIQY